MSLLTLKHVYYSYEKQPVLADIHLTINQGEVFCLTGPNGSGKTTLLDCILGLLTPQAGEIDYNNKNLRDFRPKELAKEIAYVPQNHQKTFPYTVTDIVSMGRTAYTGLFGIPSKEDLNIVQEVIERMGLAEYKDKPYTQLSGGEAQLVMIARALAQKANLIIMDEPTAHLDFRHELQILETIVNLVQKENVTILMSTHFPNHSFYLQRLNIPVRVGLMSKNSPVIAGRPEDVLTETNLRHIYQINTKIVSYSIPGYRTVTQIVPISTKIEMEEVLINE